MSEEQLVAVDITAVYRAYAMLLDMLPPITETGYESWGSATIRELAQVLDDAKYLGGGWVKKAKEVIGDWDAPVLARS